MVFFPLPDRDVHKEVGLSVCHLQGRHARRGIFFRTSLVFGHQVLSASTHERVSYAIPKYFCQEIAFLDAK